jgi:hypothetical protein
MALRRTEMKRTGFKPASKTGKVPKLAPAPKERKRLRTKQLAVTAEEKALWDRLASEIGCVACMIDGRRNTHVSIHHCDGRTKPGCHKRVLPLCAGHHQDGTGGDSSLIAVHPYKARFEARYGTQAELMETCFYLLRVIK